MRTVKKLLATVLAILTIFSVCAFSSSAKVAAPEFELKLVSETASTVVLQFNLVKGSFNSLDVTFAKSSDIKECTAINSTPAFNQVATATTNKATGMISCIALTAVKAPITVCEITYQKKSGAVIDKGDFGVVVTSCSVTTSGISGSTNTEIADDVKVNITVGSFSLNQDSLAMNYKNSAKIDYTSNYAKSDLEWTSSNEKVATVDDEGNVYAAGTGSATITVKSADGIVNETVEVTVSYTVLQWIIVIVLFGWIWY